MGLEQFPNNQENTEKAREERLSSLLSRLDNPILASRQQKRYEDAEDKDAMLDDIEEVVAEREDFLEEKFPDLNLDNFLEKEAEQQAQKIQEVVQEAIKGNLAELGEGGVAQVSRSAKHPELCYKRIYEPKQYKMENLITKEIELMNTARKLNTTAVKLPRTYYCVANKKHHVYIMETLDAMNLEDAIAGREAFPENFDPEGFFDELQNFLDEQHQAGIHHRDLHGNNIMIDRQTGLPCVIDYGKAIQLQPGDEEDPYLREIETAGGGAKGARTWMKDDAKAKQFRGEVVKKFKLKK